MIQQPVECFPTDFLGRFCLWRKPCSRCSESVESRELISAKRIGLKGRYSREQLHWVVLANPRLDRRRHFSKVGRKQPSGTPRIVLPELSYNSCKLAPPLSPHVNRH